MWRGLLCAGWLALPVSAQVAESFAFPDYQLKFTPPALDSLAVEPPTAKGCKGLWTARLGSSNVRILFHVMQGPELEFPEAEDVVESWRQWLTAPDAYDSEYSFGPVRTRTGAFGTSPILALIDAEARDKKDPKLRTWMSFAGGVIGEAGWSLRIEVSPWPADSDIAGLKQWLETCASYDGKLRDPKWSDDAASAFFKKHVPEPIAKHYQKPTRTEHFIVLTDTTPVGVYAKKYETGYAAIRKLLPFEEIPGRQLMPVVLLRSDSEFQAYYRAVYKMGPKEPVDRPSFVADRALVTSCENRDDYESLADLTKLVMHCRLRILGGPRWFYDGLSDFVACKPKERANTVAAVKLRLFTPVKDLLDDAEWDRPRSDVPVGEPGYQPNYWEQSGMWMEFLHDRSWPNDLFPRFLGTVGGLRYGDGAGAAAAVEAIYGMKLSGLEELWLVYFAKRK